MPDQNNTLEAIIDQIFNADCQLLLAGLTVLSKDLSEFLTVNAYFGPDTQLFTEIFATTLNDNRFFWLTIDDSPGNNPQETEPAWLYRPLSESGMPVGFAAKVVSPDFSMELLLDANTINKEWTRHPGWGILLSFRKAFCNALCQKDGVIKKYLDMGDDDKKTLANQIAEVIVNQRLSDATYWRPFTGQLSVLIAKTDLEAYYAGCQNGK